MTIHIVVENKPDSGTVEAVCSKKEIADRIRDHLNAQMEEQHNVKNFYTVEEHTYLTEIPEEIKP